MKLFHITFQGGKENKQRKFSEIYREQFCTGPEGEFKERTWKMLELIEHLEQNVEGPTQWVTTSHASLLLRDRDYEELRKVRNVEGAFTLSIDTFNRAAHYEISYYLPKSAHPWHALVGSTDDVRTAGQMVAGALLKAPELARLLKE